MSKDMETLNIKLWEEEYGRCSMNEQRLKVKMDNDPTTMLLDCHFKLSELLKKYQGKDRLTPQFNEEIKKLARKEQRAKVLQSGYDMIKVMDEYHEAKIHTSNVLTALENFKFRYRLQYEKNKDKREAMSVEKLVDEVSK